MAEERIEAHKITKPIQLLGAWLAGLAIVNSSFLLAAASIDTPPWIPALLAIAAVANVPVFIISLFILQTKFRPEMQEDAFYSKYLERKYTTQSKIDSVDLEKNIKSLAEKILGEIPKPSGLQTERVEQILKESEIGQLVDRFEDNRTLSEVFLHNDGWTEIVEAWSDDPSFQKEITDLKVSGLLTFKDDDIKRPKLTPIGKAVAERLAQDKRLWNNKNERYFPKKK